MNENAGELAAEDIDQWFQQEDEAAEATSPSAKLDPAIKYATSQLRVVRETKDYQLDYLQHALKPGNELIDISPTYQRRLRWSNKKKSLLIESFLLNIPVPPIFLFERDYNEYEVIDGRQRLDAISSFLSNDYALVGLEYWSELNRSRFEDLPRVLQKGLLRRSLPAVVLLAETKEREGDEKIDVRRVLFDRLNTGGIQLNPQELRNALYPGPFNALLIRLARSTPFTEAWRIPSYTKGEEGDPPDNLLHNPLFSSLADAELVLRFFALRDAISNNKKGSLRRILDNYMESNAELDEATLAQMSHLFRTCMGRLLRVFGNEIFRLSGTGRPSRPLYDALMIALSNDSQVDVEAHAVQIRHALDAALDDDENYDIIVGRGNTIGAIYDRVELAGSILRAGSE